MKLVEHVLMASVIACASAQSFQAGYAGSRLSGAREEPPPLAADSEGVAGKQSARPAPRRIRALVTAYCATGPRCSAPICGGNPQTAWGRDATVGDGCAVDPRAIPYGSVVVIDGKRYVADDTGGAMRRDWRERGIVHIDVRVAGRTHEEVRRMGAGWKEVEVYEPLR